MSNEDSILSPNAYWAEQKPNWSEWENVAHTALWKAITLACDVNPAIYLPYGLPANPGTDFGLTPILPNVRELLGLANSAVGSGTLRVLPKDNSPVMQREVNLAEFTSWLNRIGQKTPAGYLWAAKELAPGAYQWPWGSHQTQALQMLALAADRFWKRYDPKDPSSANTNEVVVAWLMGQGMSKRPAEAIASILRADNLPSGRR